ARLAAVYAPGLAPMDFHAVVEVLTAAGWQVLDPTRLAPRRALVRIATGRDAADTAFATTMRGTAELMASLVFASSDGDLPADDHARPLPLACPRRWSLHRFEQQPLAVSTTSARAWASPHWARLT